MKREICPVCKRKEELVFRVFVPLRFSREPGWYYVCESCWREIRRITGTIDGRTPCDEALG